jgi:hypothetical protein
MDNNILDDYIIYRFVSWEEPATTAEKVGEPEGYFLILADSM